MQTNINKCTKINDVLDFSGNFHSFFQIFKLNDAFLHNWSRITVTRIAVRLLQFFYNIVQSRFADAVFFAQFPALCTVDFSAGFYNRKNLARNTVIFRVNPGIIKRIIAFCNFKESGTLLKRLRTKTRNFFQIFAVCNFSVCIAVFGDFFRRAHRNAGNVTQKHIACRIKINADLIYN